MSRSPLFDLINWRSEVLSQNRLLMVSFSTVSDYLFLLRVVSQAIRAMGRNGMLYLAAAVSDFFIPRSRLPTHKIQSSDGPLVLRLSEVPKCLDQLRATWCPDAFLCSFKLETDPQLLIEKARSSLTRYQCNTVVANLLQTRQSEVFLIRGQSEKESTRITVDDAGRTPYVAQSAQSSPPSKNDGSLEQRLIAELVRLHGQWITTA